MKKAVIILFKLLVCVSIYPQWNPEYLATSPVLLEKDSNRFNINAEVVGFLKNNEYFSPIVKGATYPGVQFMPVISYQVENRLKAEFGMTGLYYSGDQQKDGVYVFNAVHAKLQYAIRPHFNLIFGNYYGGVNHRLIEPLYKWERQLIDKPESGLQLIFDNERFFVDAWLNWQRFIQKGDSVPEVLTFGTSALFTLTKPESPFKVSLPVQLLIHHQGGQIDVSEEKMIVSGNLATGISTEFFLNKKLIQSVRMDCYVLAYYDKLPDNSVRPYDHGWGIYPVITVNGFPFKLMAGYWRSRKFYSFEGEPLFSSFNTDYPDEILTERSLVTFKASYSRQLHRMFAIGAQIETYTDLDRGETDYSFGICLRFKGTLFSK